MRSAALERDDSIFPFTMLLSLFIHGLLFFVNFLSPPQPAVASVQYIYPDVNYRVFPGQNYFRQYARDEIFTPNTRGIAVPQSGDVRVEPDQLRPEPTRQVPLRGQPDPREVASVPNRVFLGDRTAPSANQAPEEAAAEEPRPRTGSYRASLTMPEGPEGIVQPMERTSRPDPAGSALTQSPSGPASGLRSGAATRPELASAATSPGGFTRGVIDVPGRPLSVSPTTPQAGRSLDHRPYTDPVSAGPMVDANPVETARPSGEPNAPSDGSPGYGPRRILYKPLPEYPEWAERDRVQATPQFYVTVGSDGRISRVRLSISSGYAELDRLAEASVRRWIYEPRPGQTEERRVVVRFVLKN